jgi:hypothetical protein
VTEEFLQLDSGFFSFKPQEARPAQPAPASTEDLDLGDGINTDGFILDLLTRLDEVHRPTDGGSAAGARPEHRLSEPPSSNDLGTLLDYLIDGATIADLEEIGPGRFEGSDELGDLCSLMTEIQLRSPSYTGEIALMILRYASNLVNRGVLFHVGADAVTAIGQFGLGGGEEAGAVEARLRTFTVPRDQPSVFLEVAEMMHTYRGPLKPCRWNDELARRLGGPRPREAVAIPIVVDGMMAAVFYGDNVPKQDAIGSVKGIELLMIEAGLAMERRLLQAKLRRVEEQLQTLERGSTREVGA